MFVTSSCEVNLSDHLDDVSLVSDAEWFIKLLSVKVLGIACSECYIRFL